MAMFDEVLVAVTFSPGQHLVFDFWQRVGGAHFIGDIVQVKQVDAFFVVPSFTSFEVGRCLVSPGGNDMADAGPAVIAWNGIEDLTPFLATVLE